MGAKGGGGSSSRETGAGGVAMSERSAGGEGGVRACALIHRLTKSELCGQRGDHPYQERYSNRELREVDTYPSPTGRAGTPARGRGEHARHGEVPYVLLLDGANNNDVSYCRRRRERVRQQQ
jgi:hypothetical protein